MRVPDMRGLAPTAGYQLLAGGQSNGRVWSECGPFCGPIIQTQPVDCINFKSLGDGRLSFLGLESSKPMRGFERYNCEPSTRLSTPRPLHTQPLSLHIQETQPETSAEQQTRYIAPRFGRLSRGRALNSSS